MTTLKLLALLTAGLSTGGLAQAYNDPAPGSAAIMSSDYATAEREIRGAQISPYDPARSLNLGVVLAKTGQREKAEREFRQVLSEEDVQIVVASGGTYSAHDVARRALAELNGGVLSH